MEAKYIHENSQLRGENEMVSYLTSTFYDFSLGASFASPLIV